MGMWNRDSYLLVLSTRMQDALHTQASTHLYELNQIAQKGLHNNTSQMKSYDYVMFQKCISTFLSLARPFVPDPTHYFQPQHFPCRCPHI